MYILCIHFIAYGCLKDFFPLIEYLMVILSIDSHLYLYFIHLFPSTDVLRHFMLKKVFCIRIPIEFRCCVPFGFRIETISTEIVCHELVTQSAQRRFIWRHVVWKEGGGEHWMREGDKGYHDHAFCCELHKQCYTIYFRIFGSMVVDVECITSISSQTKLRNREFQGNKNDNEKKTKTNTLIHTFWLS